MNGPGIRPRDWLWLLAINVVANLVAGVTLNDHPVPWLEVPVRAWPGFVVSTTISSICLVVMPRWTPIVSRTVGRWTRWLILIPTLVVLAVIGTLVAVALLTPLGYVDGWDAYVAAFRSTVKISIAMTLVFGIYTTITETLKSRLDEATLALRTKERDEAEARRVASEAQLASLESRVNPHFFFNTLNSIAALTRDDAVRAERMTTQLASLMRSSLSADSAAIPDGHGLALIRARLVLLYDGNATLSIDSREGCTTVAMDLPASNV